MNNPYFTKRDIFYYIEVCDKQKKRENLLSSLLDEESERFYIGTDTSTNDSRSSVSLVSDLKYARFFKDKEATERSKQEYRVIGEIHQMDADTFINTIPDKYDIENYITRRNLRLKVGMIRSMKAWMEYRQKYKGISAYTRVTNPSAWLPCKNCGLIPLVWEFNNGRSTACGCGESEYNHHSIHAESIMSYVTRHGGSAVNYNSAELRMNWNQWVTYGQDVFKQQKENNPNLW